ncbi:MAG TPA: hypothetical protein VK285_02300 [Gaiellaceae bacterium]|nr:hypothetical protein [Gaiellaceae bacterium]
MPGETSLEFSRPVDLAGHQQGAVEQEGRQALLDNLEPCSFQGALAGRGQLYGVAARECETATSPELGMDQDGHVRTPEPAHQAVHTRDVVPVAVTQHDDVDVARG